MSLFLPHCSNIGEGHPSVDTRSFISTVWSVRPHVRCAREDPATEAMLGLEEVWR